MKKTASDWSAENIQMYSEKSKRELIHDGEKYVERNGQRFFHNG
jgi:hypothetical protein